MKVKHRESNPCTAHHSTSYVLPLACDHREMGISTADFHWISIEESSIKEPKALLCDCKPQGTTPHTKLSVAPEVVLVRQQIFLLGADLLRECCLHLFNYDLGPLLQC